MLKLMFIKTPNHRHILVTYPVYFENLDCKKIMSDNYQFATLHGNEQPTDLQKSTL